MLKAPRWWLLRSKSSATAKRRLMIPADYSQTPKATGDISSVFPSLSGAVSPPLPPRFADLKRRLIQGHEDGLREGWNRLLAELRQETEVIRASGSSIIPELDFRDLNNVEKRTAFRDKLHKRGVAVVRGVVSEREALGWKELVKRYIQTNPLTKGRKTISLGLYPLFAHCLPSFNCERIWT